LHFLSASSAAPSFITLSPDLGQSIKLDEIPGEFPVSTSPTCSRREASSLFFAGDRKGIQMRAQKRRTPPLDKQAQAMEALTRWLGSSERANEFLQREETRRAELEADSIFVRETEQLQGRFEAAYLSQPERVDSFLGRFGFTSPFNRAQLAEFLKKVPPKMAKLFRDYIKYASRFRVLLRRKRNTGTFECRVLLPEFGWKFRVNQSDGHLQSRVAMEEDSAATEYFEDVTLQVPDAFEKLTRSNQAKFVQIDDVSGTSVLNEIEDFAYFDGGVTFIWHNAERPYLFCLIGEKVSKALLDKAGRGITAFQNEFGRAKAGRLRELGAVKKVREGLLKGGRKKQIAAEALPLIATASGQSVISRIRRADAERVAKIPKMKRDFDADLKRWKAQNRRQRR
jgi:hypothetical protein